MTPSRKASFAPMALDRVVGALLLAQGVFAGWTLVDAMQKRGAGSDPTARMFAAGLLVAWAVPVIASGVGMLLGRRAALKWGFMAGVVSLIVGVLILLRPIYLIGFAMGLYCAVRRAALGRSDSISPGP